jgi:hypothetical protein
VKLDPTCRSYRQLIAPIAMVTAAWVGSMTVFIDGDVKRHQGLQAAG